MCLGLEGGKVEMVLNVSLSKEPFHGRISQIQEREKVPH